MTAIVIHISERAHTALNRVAHQTGRTVEELAEAAVEDAAIRSEPVLGKAIIKGVRVRIRDGGGMQGIVHEVDGAVVHVHWDDDTFTWEPVERLEVVP